MLRKPTLCLNQPLSLQKYKPAQSPQGPKQPLPLPIPRLIHRYKRKQAADTGGQPHGEGGHFSGLGPRSFDISPISTLHWCRACLVPSPLTPDNSLSLFRVELRISHWPECLLPLASLLALPLLNSHPWIPIPASIPDLITLSSQAPAGLGR